MSNQEQVSNMQVQVRAFASLRQALGTGTVSFELPPGATVAQLLERLSQEYPATERYLPRALVAVNQDYADRSHALSPGDEVAVFPPVSGGAPGAETGPWRTHAALSSEPIDPDTLTVLVAEPGSGALVTFGGLVRDNNLGRDVNFLEYEAYPEMAEAKLRQVVAEARERWPKIRGVAVVHRTGHLEIGELAVLVAVGAPHRDDGAFEAARYVIDRTKEIVPIWKKEAWADGEEWLEGDYQPAEGE
jgi:molybdopterin synthase catalytic subunit